MNPPRPELDDQMIDWLLAYDEALETGDIQNHRSLSHLDADQRLRLSRIVSCVRQLHELRQAETSTPRDVPTPPNSPPAAGPLAQLGRFDVGRLLGGGGFGLVYLAYDRVLRREVAVKVPQPDALMTPEARERFLREGQIAAALAHPNLVRILEVGAEGALVYHVSEFCSGPTLEAWLRDRTEPVAPAEAAELLAQLADGVADMHRHGVLHRDLKPANVLLQNGTADERGSTRIENQNEGVSVPIGVHPRSAAVPMIPRITDFGLAKDVQRTTQLTQEGALVGTPRYMAPEQALAGAAPVGPAADVYALGTILYELLAARPPFIGGSDLDTLRQIVQDDPVPLRRLRADTPADLETICLKCLEKEPPKRYDSAAALADDLRRFQAGEPIQARPIGRLELAWRWCKRNRAAAAFLIVLLVGTTVSSVLAVVANQQTELARNKAKGEERARKKAEETRDEAQRMVELMASEGQLQVLEKQEHLSPEQVALLKALVAYYQRFVQEEASEEQARTRQARGYSLIGYLQARLGYVEEAASAYSRAVRLDEQLAAEFPTALEHLAALGTDRNSLGRMLRNLGKHHEAETELRRALELQQKLTSDSPKRVAFRAQLAETRHVLGALLRDRGRRKEAEAEFGLALALQQQVVEESPGFPKYRANLAQIQDNLGKLCRSLGKWEESERLHRQAQVLLQKLTTEFPAISEYFEKLAICHNNLGLLHHESGKQSEAVPEFRRGIELQERLTTIFPAVQRHREELAACYNNLGNSLKDLGNSKKAELGKSVEAGNNHKEAEIAFRKAVDLRQKQVGEYLAQPDFRMQLAQCHNNLGGLLIDLGRYTDAETEFQQALDLKQKLAADFPGILQYAISLAASYLNHGQLMSQKGQPLEALSFFEKTITTIQPMLARDPRLQRERLLMCAAHVCRARQFEALRYYDRALPEWQRALEQDHQKLPEIRLGHAGALARLGQPKQAIAAAEELARGKARSYMLHPGNTLLGCASVFALASAALKDDAALQEQYAARAVELLCQMGATGYADLKGLETYPEFESLRDRPDFRRLLDELRAKTPKKP